MSIIEFLEARLAEDEADWCCAGSGEYANCDKWSDQHLREVEAKRAFVSAYLASHTYHQPPGRASKWTFVLNKMASVYADHPDYNPAWADSSRLTP